MKKNYDNFYIIFFLIILIIVDMPNLSVKSFYSSLGASVISFAVGLIIGFVFTGFFMIFYNLFKPDNKVRFSKERRIIIGLIFAILYALLDKLSRG